LVCGYGGYITPMRRFNDPAAEIYTIENIQLSAEIYTSLERKAQDFGFSVEEYAALILSRCIGDENQ